MGLPFGMTTLILAHTAFCVPYVYMLVKARLVGMDKSLAEAARDLGAGEVRVFFDITLPLLVPAILSGMLLSFAMSLDDVIISIFVTGVRRKHAAHQGLYADQNRRHAGDQRPVHIDAGRHHHSGCSLECPG